MTCISHRHRFAFVHIYKAGGTAISELLLPHARLRERVANHALGRKLFYATNILQQAVARGELPKGTSSWYMGLQKHAPLSEVASYLGNKHAQYLIFSVMRAPTTWVESLYNYISIRPLHAEHGKISAMDFADFVTDFIDNRQALQSRMLRGCRVPGGQGVRHLDAVFALESVAVNTKLLTSFLGLPPEPIGRDLPVRNNSYSRGAVAQLPSQLERRLAKYLEPDQRLYDAITAAGGVLTADTDGRDAPGALEIA